MVLESVKEVEPILGIETESGKLVINLTSP